MNGKLRVKARAWSSSQALIRSIRIGIARSRGCKVCGELMVGHLMMGSGPAQPAVKAGQLQVQPLAESQMQGIASPQRRRLGQSEPGGDLEILGYQRQGMQAMVTQHPKPLPGFLGFLSCNRASAHLESQGRSQFRGHPGGDQPGLLGVGLQKTQGRGCAGFVHQSRHQQRGIEVKAPQ